MSVLRSNAGCREERKGWGLGDGMNGSLPRGERRGVRAMGTQRVRGMRLTSCAPVACMTLMEWRTSADAVGQRFW